VAFHRYSVVCWSSFQLSFVKLKQSSYKKYWDLLHNNSEVHVHKKPITDQVLNQSISINQSINHLISMSVCLSIHLSVCLSICLCLTDRLTDRQTDRQTSLTSDKSSQQDGGLLQSQYNMHKNAVLIWLVKRNKCQVWLTLSRTNHCGTKQLGHCRGSCCKEVLQELSVLVPSWEGISYTIIRRGTWPLLFLEHNPLLQIPFEIAHIWVAFGFCIKTGFMYKTINWYENALHFHSNQSYFHKGFLHKDSFWNTGEG